MLNIEDMADIIHGVYTCVSPAFFISYTNALQLPMYIHRYSSCIYIGTMLLMYVQKGRDIMYIHKLE